MNVIWFANDTPLVETDEGTAVDASALGLADGHPTPDQILVNGYSYSYAGVSPKFLLYRRDHDAATLHVNLR